MNDADRDYAEIRWLILMAVIMVAFIITNWNVGQYASEIERRLPPVTTTTVKR